jgi:hypothetical protein
MLGKTPVIALKCSLPRDVLLENTPHTHTCNIWGQLHYDNTIIVHRNLHIWETAVPLLADCGHADQYWSTKGDPASLHPGFYMSPPLTTQALPLSCPDELPPGMPLAGDRCAKRVACWYIPINDVHPSSLAIRARWGPSHTHERTQALKHMHAQTRTQENTHTGTHMHALRHTHTRAET